MKKTQVIVVLVIALITAGAQAAFIVEPGAGGKAQTTNFTGAGSGSIGNVAIGITVGSIWSGTGAGGSTQDFLFSYTLGTDEGNTTISAGTDLGNGDLATGLVGGETGLYNVYVTWPNSTNVAKSGPGLCEITVTNDGADVVGSHDQNTGQSGSPGGSRAWLRVAQDVVLTWDNQYTVNEHATSWEWVAMRSNGVMWEAQEIFSAPVTINKTDIYVTEGLGEDTYTVVLDQVPNSVYVRVNMIPLYNAESDPNDIVFVVNPGGGDIEVSGPLTLTFLPSDWDIPQTVRVKAVDDAFIESGHSVNIRLETEPNNPATDPDYGGNNVWAGYVMVNITDNEVPEVRITESGDSTDVSEQGATDTYTAEMLYPPTDPVTVTITADADTLVDVGSGPVASADLVFTPAGWNGDIRTVTVSAFDDLDLEFAHTGTITHSVASADAGYQGLAVDSVVANIADDDCGMWGFHDMDLDGDCVVGLSDLAAFMDDYLKCTQPYGSNCDDLLP